MESDEVYKKIIRLSTRSYLTDGSIPRCPNCNSANVNEGDSFYEFTEMICSDCKHFQLADDYQLADWYPQD